MFTPGADHGRLRPSGHLTLQRAASSSLCRLKPTAAQALSTFARQTPRKKTESHARRHVKHIATPIDFCSEEVFIAAVDFARSGGGDDGNGIVDAREVFDHLESPVRRTVPPIRSVSQRTVDTRIVMRRVAPRLGLRRIQLTRSSQAGLPVVGWAPQPVPNTATRRPPRFGAPTCCRFQHQSHVRPAATPAITS